MHPNCQITIRTATFGKHQRYVLMDRQERYWNGQGWTRHLREALRHADIVGAHTEYQRVLEELYQDKPVRTFEAVTRLRLRELLPGRRPGSATIIDSGIARLNVVKDEQGEVFEIEATRKQPPVISVLDVQAADRHLLLLMRNSEGHKSKFLCGHDERN